MPQNRRICFVCLGNIVRSPLAENLFLQKATEFNVVAKYEVSSAGTSTYHIGENPDERMRRVAASHGLTYNGQARQFTTRDLDYYDLIFAMDFENLKDLENLVRNTQQQSKIHLLREFDPCVEPGAVVPDPYYGGVHGFEETYLIIERSVSGLLEALEEGDLD